MKTISAIKSEYRLKAFNVLRKAFKKYNQEWKSFIELAETLEISPRRLRDVLAGRTSTVTLDTLALYLDRMGYELTLSAKKKG